MEGNNLNALLNVSVLHINWFVLLGSRFGLKKSISNSRKLLKKLLKEVELIC